MLASVPAQMTPTETGDEMPTVLRSNENESYPGELLASTERRVAACGVFLSQLRLQRSRSSTWREEAP